MAEIAIADDHPLIRKGLIQILAHEPDLRLAGEAETAEQTLALVGNGCDLLLLDIDLPDRSGLELLQEVRRIDANLPVLMLSVSPEDRYGLSALRAGAAGYVRKDIAPEALVVAIRQVLAGGRYVSEHLAQALADDVRGGSGLPHETLSKRELQVLRMLATGDSLTQIAGILGLSVKSVSTYRTRLLRKIGMRSNAEIAIYATRHGLI